MKNPILIRRAVELKIVLVLSITNVISTMLILSHVSADCAFSIWGLKKLQIYNIVLHFTAEFHILLY